MRRNNPFGEELAEQVIPATFLSHVTSVLAELYTGSKIVEMTTAWGVDCGVEVPHHTYPNTAPNKRTMLRENYLAQKSSSPELRNMFQKLVEYYGKYQNTYIKHNDAVIEEEVEFVFEITSSFLKHLIKVHERH